MGRVPWVVGTASVALLSFELAVIRLFDVLLSPAFGSLVLTTALFSLGVSGLFATLRPGATAAPPVVRLAGALGVTMAAAVPLLGAIRFELAAIVVDPLVQAGWFALVSVAVGTPFFVFGLLMARVLAAHADRAHRLYAANLLGSALGCAAVLPVVPTVGAAGAMLVAAGAAFLAAAIAAPRVGERGLALAAAALVTALPAAHWPRTIELREYVDKHAVRTFRDRGEIERTVWDAVSKIDVVPVIEAGPAGGGTRERFKHVAYDGGSQTSRFTPFDGDVAGLRRRLDADPSLTSEFFWQRGVLAAHHLRRDRGADVLVIGSAGGQETLAALLYGAAHVDAVEMVGAVVDLATGPYGDYVGRLFDRDEVDVHVDEGRSFLRRSDRRYDVVQVFSNHLSSSMAGGASALDVVPLQTVEAYREFLTGLKDDGLLQVNHQVWPRTVHTAAAAWRSLGRGSFRRHVVVIEREMPQDLLPTVLIRATPWTAGELADLRAFLSERGAGEAHAYRVVEDPLDESTSFLPDAYFEGELPAELRSAVPYRVDPPTDDRPFFSLLRRRVAPVAESRDLGLDRSTAKLLNDQLVGGRVPSEWVHLAFPATVGLVVALLVLLAPFLLSPIGRARWDGRGATLVYFAAIGAGFIALELVLVQLAMRPIGFPLHAYSTVLCVVLCGAGLGSLLGGRLRLRSPVVACLGVLAAGALVAAVHPIVFDALIGRPRVVRIAGVALLLLPLALSLGLPFPWAVRHLASRPPGAIAWGYAMNGVATVLGGVAVTVASLLLGFRAAFLLGLVAYAVALLAGAGMAAAPSPTSSRSGGEPSERA